MKRQRGRNRGGGGGGGGGGKPQHNANRAFDSNGPDNVKIRGAAQHVYEKYQQLARDAGSGGDRVLAENYLQHAEHYFRVLRAMQPQRPLAEIIGRDQFVSGYDIDFEDESGEAQGAETPEGAEPADGAEGGEPRFEPRNDRQDRYESRDQRPRDDRPRDDRPRDDRPRDDFRRDRPRDDRPPENRFRDDRPRDDRPRDDRPPENRFRDERPRDDRPRDDRPRDDRLRDDRPRDDRPMADRPRDDRPAFRDDRPRDDRPRERDRFRERDRLERQDRAERDPLSVVEPEATPLVARDAPPQRVLRADDGEVSHAPAFLQVRPAAPAADDGEAKAPRVRRRRAPPTFEGGAAAPAEADET